MKQARPFGFFSDLFSRRRSDALTAEPTTTMDHESAADGHELQQDVSVENEGARTAAETGDPIAQNTFGLELASGMGLHESDHEARKWLHRAAQQGHADAQFNLGNLCQSASLRDSPSDFREARIEAYTWFFLAAAQGHERAKASCEALNLQLTDEELAEGNRRARAFQSRKEVAGQ